MTGAKQTTDGGDPAGYTTAYTYKLGGSLDTETYPSGRVVKNELNTDGTLSLVESRKDANHGFWTYANSFTYNPSGAVTKMQLGNGRWENETYNSRLQVTQIGLGSTDSAQDLLKLDYTYDTTGTDNNGSLREQQIKVPTVGTNSVFTAIQDYTYDDLNRIATATETVSSSQTWKQEFSYDRYGNRTFVTGTDHTTTLASCSTAVCNPTAGTTANKFSSSDGYSYDSNGSMTEDATGQRFGYDAENHQTQYFTSSNSGSTPDATYSYDGEGRRVKKVSASETTIFVYDTSSQVIAEYSTALASTPQVSYITQDSLGSTRVITNENGVVTNRKDYMAFGEIATSSHRVGGSSGNGYDDPTIREDYTGYQKDSESGLEFAQARYFNPQHGRYTSVDPLTASATVRDPQSFNRYSYALNSPYKFTDPLGLRTVETNYNYAYDSPLAYGGAGGALSAAASSGESWSLDTWDANASGYILKQPDGSTVVNGVVMPAVNQSAEEDVSGRAESAEGTFKVTSALARNLNQIIREKLVKSIGTIVGEQGLGQLVPGTDGIPINCLAYAIGISGWAETDISKPSSPLYIGDIIRSADKFEVVPFLAIGEGYTSETAPTAYGARKVAENEPTPFGYRRIRMFFDPQRPDNWHVMRQDGGTWSSKDGIRAEVRNITSPNVYYSKNFMGGRGGFRTVDYVLLDVGTLSGRSH